VTIGATNSAGTGTATLTLTIGNSYFVSTAGSDSNAGTLAAPFATVAAAQSACTASSGDIVYIRGGTYSSFSDTTAYSGYDTAYWYIHQLTKSGITYMAYPDETPIFDFSSASTTLRVCGFRVTGASIVIKGLTVTGTPVGSQKQSENFRIEGSTASCTFYDCICHDTAANGFYFTSSASGSCIRCDAYNNIGVVSVSAGNTDGFGAHGTGVVFKYCRSWHNSDDGFDCISSPGANTYDHCWAYNNGVNGGDSNGFKIGGFGNGTDTSVLPSTIPAHTVKYCVSASNGSHGFYANHQPGQAATWTYNTAYANSSGNYDMLERLSDMSADCSGYREILHYNIGYSGTIIKDDANTTENTTTNSWTLSGVTVDSSDFQSVDSTQLANSRVGVEMPFVTFMHLTSGSDLAGLGAFADAPTAPSGLTAEWEGSGTVSLGWTAASDATTATTYLVKRATTSGGTYTVIASEVLGTHYIDTTATGATSYYYVVSAMNGVSYDQSSNSNEASAIQGPTTTITGVTSDNGRSSSDGITNDTTLIISGSTASTTGASAAYCTVTVSSSTGGVLGTATADADGLWSFDYTGTTLADGTYTFSATAANGGYTGLTSSTYTVVVDTSAPAAPVISSVSGSPLVFTGTAEASAIVTIVLDGTSTIGTATAGTDGSWSFTSSTTLSSGVHYFTATATDTAGNVSASSSTWTIDSSVTVPTITGISSDTGTSSSDGITNDKTLILSGTADAGATITVYLGGSSIGTTTADSTGAWTFDYTGTTLSDATYSFTAIATVGSSNSATSSAYSVTVDTTAPAASSIVRSNPSTATITVTTTSVTFKVTFGEAVSGVDTSDFALTTTGTVAGTIASVTAESTTVYDVVVSSISGIGTLQLGLNSGGIADTAGNTNTAYSSGEAYTCVTSVEGSGTWTQTVSGGLWSYYGNWDGAVIPDGTGDSASFATLDLTSSNTVHLDSTRTVNSMTFGDTATTSAYGWVLDSNGSTANILTLGGTTPTITVSALGTGAVTSISAPLAGTAGMIKAGAGTLALSAANSLTGPLTLSAGILQIDSGGSLALDSAVVMASSTTLSMTGGTLSTTGAVTMSNSRLTISSGSVTFSGGLTTSWNKDGYVKISGGTLTA